VTRYNSRGTRSSGWKLKAGAGGLAVVGGIAGGLALTSHPTAIHDSAYDFGFGEYGYGAMLNSAMAGFQTHNFALTQRSLRELSAIQGFGSSWNVYNHHQRSTVEFQRGRIVLITHHFLIVRGFNGRFTVWKLAGNTVVADVVPTVTATPKPIVATPTPSVPTSAAAVVTPTPTAPASIAAVPVTAAVPTLTTSTAAQAVTGGTSPTTILNSTAAAAPSVTTVSVTTGTITITITITSTPAAATVAPTAKVTTPVTTTTPATTTTPTTTTVVPTAALTWHGLAAGDLVFVAGSERHHVRTAELVLIEALAHVTPAPTPTPTWTPAITPTPTAPATVAVTPTPAVTPTTTVSPAPTVSTTPTYS
jgi:hypothetical protein